MDFPMRYLSIAAVAFYVISLMLFSLKDANAGYVDTVANFEIGGRVYFHDPAYGNGDEYWGWVNVPTVSIATSSWSELENFMDISHVHDDFPNGLIYAMRFPFAGGYLVTFDLIWTANFPFHLEITESGLDSNSMSYYSETRILTPYADMTDPYDPDLPESYQPFAEFIHIGDSFQIIYREDGGGTFTGNLSYTLYQDGDPKIDLTSVHICENSKHIAATAPIPGAIWLMGTGMSILAYRRKRIANG